MLPTNTPTAAAVLVIDPYTDRVLGFLRARDGDLGLPCGKIEPNETAEEAAIRECYEETGYAVAPTEEPPFMAYDPVGRTTVACYRAKASWADIPTHPNEGSPCWVSPSQLLLSRYAEYNRAALRHFKVLPLTGRFHSHLTLRATPEEAGRARDLVGGKITLIDLQKLSRTQTDVMLTHHYVTGHRGLENQHDVLAALLDHARRLKTEGFAVERIKLEFEYQDPATGPGQAARTFAGAQYVEAHVKVMIDEDQVQPVIAAMGAPWVASRNPLGRAGDQLVQFLNARFRLGDPGYSPEAVHAEVERAAEVARRAGASLLETKIEAAIYDSNTATDAWWA